MAEVSFPEVKDTIIQEGLARANGYRDAMYPEASNFGDFSVEDAIEERFNRDTGFFDGVGAAFRRAGLLYGAAELGLTAATRPEFPDDPTFDLVDSYESDSTLRERLDPYMTMDNWALLEQVGQSKSVEEVSYILDLADQNEDRRKIAQHSWGAEAVGTIASIGVDIAALIALGVTTRGLGLSGLAEAIPLVRAIQGSRVAAGARGVAWGAGLGGAEMMLHQQTDHTVKDSDVLFAMAMGGLIGGGIGAAFPKTMNVDTAIRMTEDELAEVVQKSISGKAAAAKKKAKSTTGAAEVGDPELRPLDVSEVSAGVVAPSARSILADYIPLPKKFTRGILRSPKRVIVDMGGRGVDQLRKLGLTGNAKFYHAAQRLLKFSTAHADEIEGSAVRNVTAQDTLDGFLTASTAVSRQAEFHFREALEAMFSGASRLRLAMASGHAGRTLGGSYKARRFFAGLDVPTFERIADRLRKAEARLKDGGELNKREIIGDEIFDQLTDEQVEHLMAGLKKAANDQEMFYQTMGRREVELGIIPEEDLIPGYTPQIWNREALKANKQRFMAWMTRVWGQEVDEWWVRKEFQEVLDEAGEVQVAGIREGETLEAFAKRDPEAFNEVQRMWDEGLADAEAAMVRDAQSEADRLVEEAEMGALPGILERLVKGLKKDKETLASLEDQLGKVKRAKKKGTKAKVEEINDKITKLERKIDLKESRLKHIREATAGTEAMRAALKGALPKAARSKLKRLYAMQDKQTRKVKRQSSKSYVSEQVEDLYRLMTEGEAYMGVVPDKFKITSNRFKRRAIYLGKHEFDEEADMFLMRDQAMMRESFARGVGSQVAIREVFGMDGPNWSREQVLDEFMSGFEADKIKFKNDPEQLAKIAKEEAEAREMADFILKDFLGDIGFQQDWLSKIAAPTMAATSAAVLGKVLLSSIGDLAIQAFAGGKFMTGFQSFFRRNAHIFEELRAEGLDYDEMSIFLEGLSSVNGRRFSNYADLERFDFDIPGSKFRKVSRVIDDIATLEGWASMMHVWNKHIRGAFGIDFANQIFKHSQGSWDNLSPSLQMFYQRHGIGKLELEGLGSEFKRAGKQVGGGRLTVPDIAKFDSRLYDVWKRAMKGAGDEAMLDPSIGDRPFAKSHAMGRLMIQFQSFVFTAADRYMAPLMQSMRLHRGEARNYWSLFIAFGVAGINDGIRAHMIGKGQEWRDNWSTGQGKYNNLISIFMRSPLAVSGTSWMYESVSNLVGASGNEALEELIGFAPLRETTKWQQGQGMAGIFGPAVGLLGTGVSIGNQVLEGDYGKAADRFAARVPILNTLLPQFSYVWMTDKLEE